MLCVMRIIRNYLNSIDSITIHHVLILSHFLFDSDFKLLLLLSLFMIMVSYDHDFLCLNSVRF